MQAERLVYMVNQIGDFFKSYPHDQAVAGIADHVRKFWEPRMRKEIYAVIAKPGHGLKPQPLEAIQSLAKKEADKFAKGAA
jgi:formate dehydrogenase subunit delta